MKMKKQIYTLLAGLMIVLSLSSCNSWLEEKPTSNIGPEQVGDSNEAVSYWVTGVYSNWLYDMFCWDQFPAVLELDNDYISGPDWLFGSLGAGNFNGDDKVDKLWTGPYNLINDANLAIRYIDGMKNITDDVKNNAIGEMLFQKAFCYFLMVRAFGPIPYYETDVSNGADFFKPREDVSVIYGHIISMLEEAAEKMYNIDNPNYQSGHVSAGSAAGLLAKVYATMGSASLPAGTEVVVRTGEPYEEKKDVNGNTIKIYRAVKAETIQKDAVAGYNFDSQECYENAAKWAKKVIDGEYGLYELLSYDNLWKATSRNASEFMFSVQSVNGETKYRSGVHTFYSGYKSTSGSEFLYSGGWVGNTNNWYQLFDETDYRVAKGVRHFWRYYYQEDYDGCFYYPQSWVTKLTNYDIYGNWTGTAEPEYLDKYQAWQYNTSSECLAFTTKYDDCVNDATNNADSNWPFLRYADVMLIYAEAQNELGNQSEAMKYLNIIRARSNAEQMTTETTKSRMRSTIIEERAKELACEGDRRWDLIRWGIYLQAMAAIGERDDSNIDKRRTERNLLYPIPTAEINANPYIDKNNPGW